MKNKQGGDASFLLGLVLGIFIGAAVALILAPQPGEETRAMLAEKMQGTKEEIEGRVRD